MKADYIRLIGDVCREIYIVSCYSVILPSAQKDLHFRPTTASAAANKNISSSYS